MNELLRVGDAKAGAVLAFAGGSAAFLVGKTDLVRGVIVEHAGDVVGWVLYLIFMAYGVALVLTFVFAFRSILPALGVGNQRSLIYFKHIFEDYKHDHGRYAKALGSLSDDALEQELAHQVCANAAIATAKFDFVSKAIYCLAWTGAFWVLTVFALFIYGSTAVQ